MWNVYFNVLFTSYKNTKPLIMSKYILLHIFQNIVTLMFDLSYFITNNDIPEQCYFNV